MTNDELHETAREAMRFAHFAFPALEPGNEALFERAQESGHRLINLLWKAGLRPTNEG